MSDPTRRLAEWLDGEGYVVCEWDGDPEWAGRSVLTPVEGWEDAARSALSSTPAPTREAQREIVRDWLDTGHETGRMEYDELLDRLALATTPAPDYDAMEREWLDATPPAGQPLIHGIFQRLRSTP